MKGSMLDVIFIGVTLVALSFGVIIASMLMSQIQTSAAVTMPLAANAMNDGTAAINTFNYGFVFIAIGLFISSLIFAWLTPTHPIFMIAAIVSLLIAVLILPILSNVYGTFNADSVMSGASSNFPLMSWMMQGLPLLGTVFGVLLIIVMYTRWQNSGTA